MQGRFQHTALEFINFSSRPKIGGPFTRDSFLFRTDTKSVVLSSFAKILRLLLLSPNTFTSLTNLNIYLSYRVPSGAPKGGAKGPIAPLKGEKIEIFVTYTFTQNLIPNN